MPLRTPDGRYIVVRGWLWRATDPKLSDQQREKLMKELMTARREVRFTDPDKKAAARRAVDKPSANWESEGRCGGMTTHPTTIDTLPKTLPTRLGSRPAPLATR